MDNTILIGYYFYTPFCINACILLFFSGIFLWAYIHLFNRKRLLTKKLKKLVQHQEQILIESSIAIREQAFKYVSMELHDNVVQVLTLAKLNLNRISSQENDTEEALLEEARAYLSRSISDISSFSKGLDSDTILSQGLLNAIQFEVNVWNKHLNNKIDFTQKGYPPEFEQRQEVIIFRIVQEALNNIVKHAHANEVKLVCTSEDPQFTLTILDDGVGFDINEIYQQKKSRFMSGLKNMRSRAALIGGTLDFYSENRKGTLLELKIPITQTKLI